MFTYIKAKNFKSFKNLEINFNKTKDKTNNLIVIYGENGSGKTNIAEIFRFLEMSITVKDTEKIMANVANEKSDTPNLLEYLISNINKPIDMYNMVFESNRMIDTKEPTEVECGFKTKETEGYYCIKFDKKVLEEKLYYKIDKQKGILFEIKNENGNILKKLNNKIFHDKKYKEELIDTIEKYWGKYSFLSLLFFEIKDKNKKYITSRISDNIFEAMYELVMTKTSIEDSQKRFINPNINELQRGLINEKDIEKIKKQEEILRIFFTQAYTDIRDVRYEIEKTEEKDKLRYKLFFEKKIGGEIKSIPSMWESAGTQKILKQFQILLDAILGENVIIDEIDNGVHDALIKNIIMSIKDEITGQLIITTHNTLLLETLPKESIYILTTDRNGNKEVNSIKDYDINIQKNHNARDLYFKGLFGGIPLTEYINFDEIRYTLEKQNEEDEDK